MEWQQPEWLYLILPLAATWLALSLYSRHKRRRAAEAFVAQAMWPRILPAESPARFWFKLLLRETAIVTGLVALAGPRFGTQYEDVIPRGSDLYVLIDVSRSMLAEDVPPSRLGLRQGRRGGPRQPAGGGTSGLDRLRGAGGGEVSPHRRLRRLPPIARRAGTGERATRRHRHRRRGSKGPRGFSGPIQPRPGHPADHRRRRPAVVSP